MTLLRFVYPFFVALVVLFAIFNAQIDGSIAVRREVRELLSKIEKQRDEWIELSNTAARQRDEAIAMLQIYQDEFGALDDKHYAAFQRLMKSGDSHVSKR
jgi:hypothetical protein